MEGSGHGPRRAGRRRRGGGAPRRASRDFGRRRRRGTPSGARARRRPRPFPSPRRAPCRPGRRRPGRRGSGASADPARATGGVRSGRRSARAARRGRGRTGPPRVRVYAWPVALGEELARAAAAAQAFAEPGEAVALVLVTEPTEGERIYLCAYEGSEGPRSWLALDEAGEPIRALNRVREAV